MSPSRFPFPFWMMKLFNILKFQQAFRDRWMECRKNRNKFIKYNGKRTDSHLLFVKGCKFRCTLIYGASRYRIINKSLHVHVHLNVHSIKISSEILNVFLHSCFIYYQDCCFVRTTEAKRENVKKVCSFWLLSLAPVKVP